MNFGSKRTKIILAVLIAICLVISYRIYNNIQKDKARAARMGRTAAVSVQTEHPKRQTIIPAMRFSGSLDPEWKAEVASKVDGRLARVLVNEGDQVQKGQVLAILDTVDTEAALLNAKGSYLDAKTTLEKAELDLARYEKLAAQGAVSQSTVDNYRFSRNNAAAKLEMARGNLQSAESKAIDTKIIAPAAGIVAKRYYQEGYYAKAGTPIFSVADISRLKTTIHIPEGNISGVAVGNKATIELAAYKGKALEGVITRIAPVADLPAHTFAAEVSVANSGNMRAGVFANVKLKAEPKENAMVIPLQAVVMRDDQKTVFVPDEKGYVQRRVLDVGYMDDKVVEVLGGITEKDLVVVEGHNKLREGTQIKLQKAGK